MRKATRNLILHMLTIAERMSGDRLRIVPTGSMHTIYEQQHLKKFITRFGVDCVFDIGANKGQYAKMLREKVSYRGLIISFEPDPECVAVLKDLSRSDPFWHVEESPLSDKSGVEVDFNIMVNNHFNSIARPSVEEFREFEDMNRVVKTIRLRTKTVAEVFDDYRKRLEFKRPFLKIDTQGNDLNVARGAGDTLTSFVGLQSELAIVRLYSDVPNYIESIAFYEANGFTLSAFVPNNQGRFPRLIETDCIMFNERFA
jgi:FkbM family methyltransferase